MTVQEAVLQNVLHSVQVQLLVVELVILLVLIHA